MANIQYIGARYVPKFYDNPDDESNNWKAGVAYEPLTVVTYQDNSYTSKKPVPATVSDPASEPSYWVLTANYSAAIEGLQEEVSDIENDISDIQNTISDYDTKDSFALGDITLTKYHEEHLGIIVVKIPYINSKDNSKNIPIVKATYYPHTAEYHDVDTQAAMNIGFIGGSSEGYESAIAIGAITDGVVIKRTDGYTGYSQCPILAINDDGEIHVFAAGTDLDDIKAQGYNNAAVIRWHLINNGVYNPYSGAVTPVQQMFGVDTDNNYYMITTSYYAKYTWAELAQWLLTNIPNIKHVVCGDGGGSSYTSIARIRINKEGDPVRIDGRAIGGVLGFPIHASNDAVVLGNAVRMMQKTLQYNVTMNQGSATTHTYISDHWREAQGQCAIFGNLVLAHLILTCDSGVTPDSYEYVTLENLPPSITTKNIHILANDGTHDGTLIIESQDNEVDTSIKMRVRVNSEAPASDTHFTFIVDLWYTTRITI